MDCLAPGRWCGGLVAVKIVAHNCALSSLAEVLRESALSTSIQHPNVVRASCGQIAAQVPQQSWTWPWFQLLRLCFLCCRSKQGHLA